MKNLPIYEFLIDDSLESGVKCISIVPDPAFKSKAILFHKTKPLFVEMASSKPKKRKICGLALIPNVLIFRQDETTGENYYGFFSAETIEKIVEKFHDENNNNNVNLNHDAKQNVDAVLIEDYIVDSQARVEDLKLKGITHENIMGSWAVTYKIKNEEVFNSIIENQRLGNPVGLSVEAILDTFLVQMSLGITKNNMKKEMKKNYKSLMDKIIDIFRKEELERALVPELGFEVIYGEVGQPVQQVTIDAEGNETLTPLGPGEFKTDTGIIVVDDSSNLVEVRDLPVEEEPEVEVEMPDLMLPAEDMPTDTSTGDTTNTEMKDYPWDQCIADRQAEGYGEEAANKICGYIKSKNMKSEDLTKEMIDEILKDDCPDCNKKQYSEVEFKGLEIKFDEQTATLSELKVKFEEVQKENEALKTENNELKEKMKEPINEPVLDAPIDKKDWAKMSAFEKALYKSRQ